MTITTQKTSFLNLGTRGAAAALIALVSIFPSRAHALTLVTERTALDGNDSLDWSSLGKVFDPFNPDFSDFLTNSFPARSLQGLGVNVDIPLPSSPSITPPFVFQTLPLPTGVPTNFAPGDFILFTGFQPVGFPALGNPGPLTLTFDIPVWAAGTQIAVDDVFSFNASISAFDPDGNLLGTFSAPGTSSIELDDSALFLGVSSDAPNIAKLVYSTSESASAFGINRLSLRVSVPEPSPVAGMLVLSIAGAAVACFRVRNRNSPV